MPVTDCPCQSNPQCSSKNRHQLLARNKGYIFPRQKTMPPEGRTWLLRVLWEIATSARTHTRSELDVPWRVLQDAEHKVRDLVSYKSLETRGDLYKSDGENVVARARTRTPSAATRSCACSASTSTGACTSA